MIQVVQFHCHITVREALLAAHREDLIGSGPKCLIRAIPPKAGGYTAPPPKAPAKGKPAANTLAKKSPAKAPAKGKPAAKAAAMKPPAKAPVKKTAAKHTAKRK